MQKNLEINNFVDEPSSQLATVPKDTNLTNMSDSVITRATAASTDQ